MNRFVLVQVSLVAVLALTGCSGTDQPAVPSGGSSLSAGAVPAGALPFSATALCAHT